MLYLLRLTNGDCVIATAADERSARQAAMSLSLDEVAEVATVRPLSSLGIRFSPTEEGSLEVAHWDDATLDGILANEYPLLYQAYHRANAGPFMKAAVSGEPMLAEFHAAYERNTEIIREGLRRERQRFNQEVAAGQTTQPQSQPNSKAAKSRA